MTNGSNPKETMTENREAQTRCIHCGRELPEGSSFCPFCEKEQRAPENIAAPKNIRRPLTAALLVLAAVAAVCAYVVLQKKPKSYVGGDIVEYPINGRTYRIAASFNYDTAKTGMPSGDKTWKLAAGESAANPLHLYAFCDEDPQASETFAGQLESFAVSAIPRDGAQPMECINPRQTEDTVSGISWVADVIYAPENGTNDLCWDLVMKNGDTIHLQNSLTCELLPTVEFRYEDTPLETVEDIQAVIESVMASETPDASICLYLPPVTYTEPLTLDRHPVTVFGTITDTGRTTFTRTVTVPMRGQKICEFYDTAFIGNGGTGLEAREGVSLTNCLFSGWDVAADSRDGSWIDMRGCDFTDNGIGFRFNSLKSTCSCVTYESMFFSGNHIAVQIENIPRDQEITFLNSLFEKNDIDVDDPKGLAKGY